jgi:hypothetical protein
MLQADVLRDEGNAPGHFLGSVVLAPTKAVVGGPQRWLVVDGQQRLTTLTVALCALRDHVRADDPRAADRIHRQLLVNEYQDGAERAKLVPVAVPAPADPRRHPRCCACSTDPPPATPSRWPRTK